MSDPTITDWIGSLSTLGAGFVVFWYTIETRNMRIEMKRQNDQTLAKDRIFFAPNFKWRVFQNTGFTVHIALINQGYRCTSVKVIVPENIIVTHPTCQSMEHGEELGVNFRVGGDLVGFSDPFLFSIDFVTALGEGLSAHFEYNPQHATLKEVNPDSHSTQPEIK